MITLDFETKSEADLKKVGAYKYSMHPTTEVMCVGWDLAGRWQQWRYGEDPPEALFQAIYQLGLLAEAHNVYFERCIWENVCVAKYGWPSVQDSQWRCSAAKAATHAVPRALGLAGFALNLKNVKDNQGNAAMKKLAKPRKPTKNDKRKWYDEEELWQEMLDYNKSDVYSEKELSETLEDLSDFELKVWQADQRMNLRGFAVDVEGCRKAIEIYNREEAKVMGRFIELTDGLEPTQRQKFKAWAKTKGVELDDTTADTLDNLPVGTHPDVAEAAHLVREMGRSAVAKYWSILQFESDGRVRGCFVYSGAELSGRWAGKGVQPQNFLRGGVKDMEAHWAMILADGVELVAEDVAKYLAVAVRGAIWASAGRELLCMDFSSIEARVTAWLVDQLDFLDVFIRGDDPYLVMAEVIYGRKLTKEDKDERFLGKQAVLALGFGMGFVRFLGHCRSFKVRFSSEMVRKIVPAGTRNALKDWMLYGNEGDVWRMITQAGFEMEDLDELVLMKYVVDLYRKRNDKIKKAWYEYEDAAKAACGEYGTVFTSGKIKWKHDGRFLMAKLPSGRKLHWPFARVEHTGDITYMSASNGQWRREKTWGGTLFANIVQAIARDLMADRLVAADEHPVYNEVVAIVHDEMLVEVDEGVGDLAEFKALMEDKPAWAKGLPVGAEGWRGRRYRKA